MWVETAHIEHLQAAQATNIVGQALYVFAVACMQLLQAAETVWQVLFTSAAAQKE